MVVVKLCFSNSVIPWSCLLVFYKKKLCPFIRITLDPWILLLFSYQLLSLFFLVLKLSQMWSGNTFKLAPVFFLHFHHSLNTSLLFVAAKYFSLPGPALIPFMVEWYLEMKIWALGMLIATVSPLKNKHKKPTSNK